MTSEAKIDKLKRLLKRAKALRQPHEESIRDAYELAKPSREFDRQKGTATSRILWNASLARGARNLNTNVNKLLIPQNKPFAEIVLKTDFLKKNFGAQLAPALAHANDVLFNHYLNSNFFLATTEALYDAIIAGTGCVMQIDEETSPLEYLAIPIGQLFFLEDYDQKVDTVFRQHEMTARQVVSRFGDKVPENITTANKERPDQIFKIVESVVPENGVFEYSVHLMSNWEVLDEGIMNWNPFIVFRWEKSLGNVWGESPVRTALPAARIVNTMSRDTVKYGEFAAKGLWQVEDETINVEHLSGQMNPGNVIAIDTPLQPVPFAGQFNLNFELIKMQEETIKQLMFDDTLPSEDSLKFMTAEAVIELRSQFLQQVGEPAQRLSREYLKPMAVQTVGRLQQRGEISAINPDNIRALGIEGVETQVDLFRVEVNAAIQQAVKMQDATNAMNAILRVSQIVANIPPQVGIHLKMDDVVRELLTAFGTDAKLLASPQEVRRLQEQAAQLAAAAAQQQAAAQGDQQPQ